MGMFDDLIPGGGKGGGGGRQVGVQQRSAAMAKIAAARQLREQLKNVRGIYDKTLKGVGPWSLLEYLPTPANREFDAAAAGMVPLARQAFRVPGSGADSDAEQAALVKGLIPRARDFDSENEQRMRQLEQMIGSTEREWGPIAGVAPSNDDGWKIERLK